MAIDDGYVYGLVRATVEVGPGLEPTLVGAESSDQVSRDPVVMVVEFEDHR